MSSAVHSYTSIYGLSYVARVHHSRTFPDEILGFFLRPAREGLEAFLAEMQQVHKKIRESRQIDSD